VLVLSNKAANPNIPSTNQQKTSASPDLVSVSYTFHISLRLIQVVARHSHVPRVLLSVDPIALESI
jgi:hypothetical protein